ncbi:hypothetical protein BKN47_08805 [Pseudomonas aeruginosa]|nr:hypothetical protein BKN47_08805 [Pseudomonas aeruginosa]
MDSICQCESSNNLYVFRCFEAGVAAELSYKLPGPIVRNHLIDRIIVLQGSVAQLCADFLREPVAAALHDVQYGINL